MHFVTTEPSNLVLRYSRRVVSRHLVVGVVCSVGLTYAVCVDPPARLMGSSIVARYGLPLALVCGVAVVVIALVDLVHPPVSIETRQHGVRLFAPPGHVQLEWTAITGASIWYRLPLEPYGLRLETSSGTRRVRFLAEDARRLLVNELTRQQIPVSEMAPY